MTDFPKLRDAIERGGAARHHETAAARGKMFAKGFLLLAVEKPSRSLDQAAMRSPN
jgi:hypothetical protein